MIEKKYFVYVLKSLKDNKFYTGYTSNLDKRIFEHNNGLSKSTQSRRPFKLVHKEIYTSRSEAMKREKFFKSGKGREFLKTLFK